MSTLFAAQAIEFTVLGRPVPQGSARSFIPKGWKRAIITTDNTKLKPWRQQVGETALALKEAMFHRETPVEITMNFYFAKPASAKKRRGMTVKPDIDKTCRSILDAITGILIEDDSQVVEMHARKHYGGPERVEVRLQEVGLKETIEEQASRYQVIMAKMKERGFEDPAKFFAEFDFLKGIYNHLQSAPHPEYYE